MRPTIVAFLNDAFGTEVFGWLVPVPGMLYAAAMIAVLLVYERRSRSAGLSSYHAVGAAVWGMAGGLIGARAFYLLLRLNAVVDDPSLIWQLDGSTMSWGAYFGGATGFGLYLVTHRERPARYADAAASALGLGPFIARFACFLNGDDFGAVSTVPWAVAYPEGSYPFEAHVREVMVAPGAAESLPVHPVQLYLAAAGLLLFLVFSWLWHRRRLGPGILFLLYWTAYGTVRFFLEFFRGDQHRLFVAGHPDAQIIALTVGIGTLVAVLALRRRRAPDPLLQGRRSGVVGTDGARSHGLPFRNFRSGL